MDKARFDRLLAVVFVVLGAVDIVVGAGFALGADYFDLDRRIAWTAGGLFVAMGIGLLTFIAVRGRRRDG